MNAVAEKICQRLLAFCAHRIEVAHDLEGWANKGISVCSFAWSASDALSVPLSHLDWRPWWEPDDEAQVLAALKAVLEDENVPKIGHNIGYEAFTWAWKYGIRIRGIGGDTMIKHAVLWPELDKALDVCASIYTKEPFWKDMGDTEDDLQLARYNALDSMVCYEINEAMEPLLSADQRAFYCHQLALLEPVLDMELRGFRYDRVARDAMVAQVNREVFAMQGELDTLAGIAPPSFREVAEAVAFKKKVDQCVGWNDILKYAKPSFRAPL